MDFQSGGTESGSYELNGNSPFPGATVRYEGRYEDIVENQRIVLTHTMSIRGHRMSASLVTFEFLPSIKGTDLLLTHQGAFFEHADGPVMREGGWRKLLDQLQAELTRD